MAAPLTLLVIVAVTITAVLFRSSLADFISERVEVVSPLNAWNCCCSVSPILVSDDSSSRREHTDIALYMAFLPAWNHLYRFLRNIFLVLVVLLACSALFPILWHLWIYAGSANSNFYYAITLLFNLAQMDFLRRELHLTPA